MTIRCIILIVTVLAALPAPAAEFRALNPIASPAALPAGARPVDPPLPVDGKSVEKAVEGLLGSWNTSEMANKIGGDFYNKSLLLDNMSTKVPRDAHLRLLSIQGVQTMSQYIQPDSSGDHILVSTVSATARTQIEFNDPTNGFRRIEGTNEYILRVKSRQEGGR